MHAPSRLEALGLALNSVVTRDPFAGAQQYFLSTIEAGHRVNVPAHPAACMLHAVDRSSRLTVYAMGMRVRTAIPVAQDGGQAFACLASKAAIRCSSSDVSIARRCASRRAAIGVASSGDRSPRATASTIAASAPGRSVAFRTAGSCRLTGRPLRAGKMRSRHKRNATVSPASAASMAFRVSAWASVIAGDKLPQ